MTKSKFKDKFSYETNVKKIIKNFDLKIFELQFAQFSRFSTLKNIVLVNCKIKQIKIDKLKK
ncbi:hypothetical protein BpHYR1_025155 [Brachionus plicatilis]|uniref:Uncharacterized protein n=1 Tax=Brachionus plicatilis TaxID=10195 RepID=A0A3M7RUM2_BRAPC|nr:hypothetical protein BpHYR1_025155 [Brachionus plicatilis]